MASSPLAVALDAGPLYGHRTGVGVAVEHLAAALAHHRDVTVVPYLVSYRARPGAGTRRLPLPAALAMRSWAATGRPRADRWLRGADVVHGTNYTAPPTALPTVVSVYDCWFLAHGDLASPAVRRAGTVLRRAVERGATVHVSSHATADAARELLSTDRVEVVHLGPIPPPDVAPSVPESVAGRRFVVSIGTAERRKDLPTLVAAFDRLPADLADVELVIAGAAGDDSDRLGAAIDALAPDRRARIHRLGPVDVATKAGLLADATMLVYPSVDEGFGFPILEAQAAGTAVVASRAGSIPEIGGDGVELADAGDADGFAAAIARVADDDAHRLRLIASGSANLDRFSWTATADGMVELYRATIEARR